MNSRSKAAYDKFLEMISFRNATVLEEYVNASTPIKIRCQCSYEWYTRPTDVNKGRWCAACSGNSKSKGFESFKQLTDSLGYTIIGQYKNTDTPLLVRCNNGHCIPMCPRNMKAKGYKCKKCSRHCGEEAAKEFYDVVLRRKGTPLTAYTNAVNKVSIKCEKGHIWDAAPDKIKNQGTWCPQCCLSHGEENVRQVLEDLEIPYIAQFTIPSLPNKRYDFCIYYEDEHYIVEFDGIQHFEYAEHFHKEVHVFQRKQHIDILKNSMAMNHGYKMIRIDYTHMDNVPEQLCHAITRKQPIHLSTPSMYSYLSGNVPSDIVKEHVSEEYWTCNVAPYMLDTSIKQTPIETVH